MARSLFGLQGAAPCALLGLLLYSGSPCQCTPFIAAGDSSRAYIPVTHWETQTELLRPGPDPVIEDIVIEDTR